MASAETEGSERNSHTTQVPAGETKQGGISSAFLEIEASKTNPNAGPVDTTMDVHSGVCDSENIEMPESAGGSEKALSGDRGAAFRSDTLASGGNDFSGSEPVNSIVDLAKEAAFGCDPCATEMVDTIDVQPAAIDAGGSMMAPEERFHMKEASTAEVVFGVSSAEQILQRSPNESRTKREATTLSHEDGKAHITVPLSIAYATQEVVSTGSLVSNQEESFGLTCSTHKLNDAYSGLAQDQEAEHDYDIDFDIDAHDMPLTGPFFDDHMFPALVGDKTEAWDTGEDDIIMEEGSDHLDSNQHADIDTKSISVEGNNNSIAISDVEESMESREGCPHVTQQQLACNTASEDSIDRVKETSCPINSQMQGHMELGGYSCNEADIEPVALGVVQIDELPCGHFEGEDARESHLQYATDDIFGSLSGKNVQTMHASETCEAKRLDGEVDAKTNVDDNDFKTASINMSHQVADVHLCERDQNPVLDAATRDASRHIKPEDAPECSRLDSCTGQGDTVKWVEIQRKDKNQGSGCLDCVKEAEISNICSDEANVDDQLMVKNYALCNDCSEVPCTEGQASTLNANIVPEYMPGNVGREETPSVIVGMETPLEDVSEPLSQEERTTVEQIAWQTKPKVENSELQFDLGNLSHVEVNTLHIKQVLKQGDDALVIDGIFTSEFDDDVPAARNSDTMEICPCEVEDVKEVKIAINEETLLNKVNGQTDGKLVDNVGSVPDPETVGIREICASSHKIKEACTVAEHKVEALDEKHRQSVEKFVNDFDGSIFGTRNSDRKECFGSGDGSVEGELAVPDEQREMEGDKVGEQEVKAIDEYRKQSEKKIMDDYEGSMPETRNTEDSFDSGDETWKRDLAVPGEKRGKEEDKVAAQEGKALDEEHKIADSVPETRNTDDAFGNGEEERGKEEDTVAAQAAKALNEEHKIAVGMPETRNTEDSFGSGDKTGEHDLAITEEERGKEEDKIADQDGKTLDEEHKQIAEESLNGWDGSMPETRKSEMEEVFVSEEGSMEGDLAVKEDEKEEEDEVADREEKALDEKHKQTAGNFARGFDGSLPETRNGDAGEELIGGGDRSMEVELAVPEKEKEAANEELKDQCAIPLAGNLPPPAADSEEATIHLPSSSDFEMEVTLCTGLTQKVTASDGMKDRKSTSHIAVSSEKCKKADGLSADASLQKSSDKRKFPKDEVLSNLSFSVDKKAKEDSKKVHVGDDHITNLHSELDEELPARKLLKTVRAGSTFSIGDLVWAKVRSHPWWPAQIFDPADASKSARKLKKSGRVLVAFFGDCTFAWLQQSQMIAFRPNFQEKVQQTTMRVFCVAIEEALEELCRRSELGLSCKHFKGSMHSTSSFPDANTGIRQGVRAERLKDIRATAEMFRPKKTLEFVRSVACSPLGAWSGTLQWGELRGHAYGLRTCMVAMHSAPVLLKAPAVPAQVLKMKRSHSSLDAENLQEAGGGAKESIKTKKLKSDNNKRNSEGKGSLVSGEGMRRTASSTVGVNLGVKGSKDRTEENKVISTFKIKLIKKTKKDHSSSSERCLDTASSEEVRDETILDDSKETLLAIAGHSAKALKRSSLKQEKVYSTSKKVRMQIKESSKNDMTMHRAVKASSVDGLQDSDADPSVRIGTETEDAYTMVPSSSRAGLKRTELSNSAKDNSAGKSDSVRKLSKVGDSLRKVASELTGTSGVPKVADDPRCKERGEKKKMKESLALEHKASPMRYKDVSNVSTEDASLLQLRRDLELLTKKSGSGGTKGKAIKQLQKTEQGKASAARSSPHWQSVPHKSQRSCVQELALAARKRKSEIIHDEVSAKVPKNSSSTVVLHRNHSSKTYISSAEKPGERRSNDKSLLLYSRRPAPPAVAGLRTSSQHFNEKLSSHMPLGLFMRFPEDFPLPSEAQLKATFIPFGPLQMSATRLYKDSASAQVVFKHGRDAESALKHAKKNPMFGQAAVTYRLRHLSHSTRVDGKTDTPPAKASSLSAPSRAKVENSGVSLEKRGGDQKVASSVMPSSSNHDTQSASEPTGDIQDQMMTLLRQVSVIVNTSPVTSDGT